MARIIGLLFSGFAVKLYGVIAAFYVASYVWAVLHPAMAAVSHGLQVIPN
jgi:hypothetical protein